jgi:hypothetical protein
MDKTHTPAWHARHTDRIPCDGCAHLLTYDCACQRPSCRLRANWGNANCQPTHTAPDTAPGPKGQEPT